MRALRMWAYLESGDREHIREIGLPEGLSTEEIEALVKKWAIASLLTHYDIGYEIYWPDEAA